MPNEQTAHIRHMRRALDLAREALADGDWPVAAVIAKGDEVLSMGRGRQNTASDPTDHAETVQAAVLNAVGQWRLAPRGADRGSFARPPAKPSTGVAASLARRISRDEV